jgi:hypothetical protein
MCQENDSLPDRVLLITLAMAIVGIILVSLSFSNAPAHLIVEPVSIEYHISGKDLQKEAVKTISITNVGRPLNDIQIDILGSSDGFKIQNEYIKYIESRLELINNKNKSKNFILGVDILNKSILNVNNRIIENNYKISLINRNTTNSDKMNIAKLNNSIIPINSLIYKLNNRITYMNKYPEISFEDDKKSIDNDLDALLQKNKKLSEDITTIYSDKLEPSDTIGENLIFVSNIADKTLDKSSTKFVVLKCIIPYKLPEGEYKGEVLIKNGAETLKRIPLSVNVSYLGDEQAAQTESKNATSTKK